MQAAKDFGGCIIFLERRAPIRFRLSRLAFLLHDKGISKGLAGISLGQNRPRQSEANEGDQR